MQMTITELRELVGEVLAEDKKAKKEKKIEKEEVSRVGDAVPKGFAYAEALDFMRPLGQDNLYHLQGQAGWGPQTGTGVSMNMDDNIVLNKNIFRFQESTGRSAWDVLHEVSKPQRPAQESIWESALHWYDFQERGLGEGTMDEKHMGFKNLAQHLARQKNVHDPAALAASIGRKKIGPKAMAKKAAAGKK